jgi:CPA1 family monovalent cation:H+ antiporter
MTLPADEQRDRPLGLFRRMLRAGQAPRSPEQCAHLRDASPEAAPRTPGRCEEHGPADGPWVQLRLCLTCGHVGCCDSSAPRHATAHFRETGHPVMSSYGAGEAWRWCYVDELLG